MIRRPPRSTRVRSSAASDVYKRQVLSRPGALVISDMVSVLSVPSLPPRSILAWCPRCRTRPCPRHFGQAVHSDQAQTPRSSRTWCPFGPGLSAGYLEIAKHQLRFGAHRLHRCCLGEQIRCLRLLCAVWGYSLSNHLCVGVLRDLWKHFGLGDHL